MSGATKARKRQHRIERDLQELRLHCIAVAGPEWMAEGSVYRPGIEGPLSMHCGVVAAAVQRRFGGVIMTTQLAVQPGTVDIHIWNKLPSGKQYDLTSDQYGGDGLNCLPYLLDKGGVGRFAPHGAARNARFYERVVQHEKEANSHDHGITATTVQADPGTQDEDRSQD